MKPLRYKYPRTFHLPWSEGCTSDDKKLAGSDHFIGQQVVITEKMDGENTTIYHDHVHARSLDSSHHWSRSRVKELQSRLYDLPEDLRICGENLYAKHSIKYDNLVDYFQVFSIWSHEECLSWKDTVEWAEILGLKTVPVLYSGVYSYPIIKEIQSKMDFSRNEGYVVRLADSFKMRDFAKSVAKYVRANHVQTDEHWMTAEPETNTLV
jgi:ATP-dependent RNA circularization protein (DNA/RNA ligase family)